MQTESNMDVWDENSHMNGPLTVYIQLLSS